MSVCVDERGEVKCVRKVVDTVTPQIKKAIVLYLLHLRFDATISESARKITSDKGRVICIESKLF